MASGAEIINTESKAPAGRGGWRPGAGRKPADKGTLAMWIRFERSIQRTAGKMFTRERLEAMARDDPWRFVERVVIPLIGLEKRQQAGRVGVSFTDGDRVTQFVLDLGPGGEDPESMGDPLQALEDFGKGVGS